MTNVLQWFDIQLAALKQGGETAIVQLDGYSLKYVQHEATSQDTGHRKYDFELRCADGVVLRSLKGVHKHLGEEVNERPALAAATAPKKQKVGQPSALAGSGFSFTTGGRAGSEDEGRDDECVEGKGVACAVCGEEEDEDDNDMLLCDGHGCSAGYHLRCLEPALEAVPEHEWLCPTCAASGQNHFPDKILSHSGHGTSCRYRVRLRPMCASRSVSSLSRPLLTLSRSASSPLRALRRVCPLPAGAVACGRHFDGATRTLGGYVCAR